jgi:hypothetical protein
VKLCRGWRLCMTFLKRCHTLASPLINGFGNQGEIGEDISTLG